MNLILSFIMAGLKPKYFVLYCRPCYSYIRCTSFIRWWHHRENMLMSSTFQVLFQFQQLQLVSVIFFWFSKFLNIYSGNLTPPFGIGVLANSMNLVEFLNAYQGIIATSVFWNMSVFVYFYIFTLLKEEPFYWYIKILYFNRNLLLLCILRMTHSIYYAE